MSNNLAQIWIGYAPVKTYKVHFTAVILHNSYVISQFLYDIFVLFLLQMRDIDVCPVWNYH